MDRRDSRSTAAPRGVQAGERAGRAAARQPHSPARGELLEEQEGSHRRGDLDAFFAADEALHAQIFVLAGYPGAWQAVQRMKLQLDRLRRLSLPEASTVRRLIDEHRAIVDAVEAGDVRAGREHISRHARRALEQGPAIRAAHPGYFTE